MNGKEVTLQFTVLMMEVGAECLVITSPEPEANHKRITSEEPLSLVQEWENGTFHRLTTPIDGKSDLEGCWRYDKVCT